MDQVAEIKLGELTLSVTVAVTTDHSRLVVEVTHVPPTVMWTTADEVDSFLQKLGDLRGRLLPEPPMDWSSQQPFTAQRDPLVLVERDGFAGDPVLHIRHPHFGWKHFIFSKADAKRLAELLIAQADKPDPPAAGRA
jgi:hypothetical protein